MKLSVDLLLPSNSPGLVHDAAVLTKAGELKFGSKIKFRTIILPEEVANSKNQDFDLASKLGHPADLAIFIERVVRHPFFLKYSTRALKPNPDWFFPQDEKQIANYIDVVLHKTRSGYKIFNEAIKSSAHKYIGFSSLDNGLRVKSWNSFGHFRGRRLDRHTQQIVNLWCHNKSWPQLNLTMYGKDVGVQFPEWLATKNIKILLGRQNIKSHSLNISNSGIHICTSETEGFGHYINEARMMGAIAIVPNAPPMNELINDDNGALVKVSLVKKLPWKTLNKITEEDLAETIERLLLMTEEQRRDLGMTARKSYEKDRAEFIDLFAEYLTELREKKMK